MAHLGSLWRFLSHNKYWIVIFIGVLIVGFLDENSFLQRINYELQIRDLKRLLRLWYKLFSRNKLRKQKMVLNLSTLCNYRVNVSLDT